MLSSVPDCQFEHVSQLYDTQKSCAQLPSPKSISKWLLDLRAHSSIISELFKSYITTK